MRRREFLAALGSVAATLSPGARAQPATKAPRVGMLYPGPQAAALSRVEAMLSGLRASGYANPAQIELILRVADNDPARIAPMAAEIVKSMCAI